LFLSGCPADSGDHKGGRAAAVPQGREKGAREATEAVAAGKLKLKEYPPLPSPANHGEYIKLLRERCQVDYEVPRLSAGVSEADLMQEVQGWNDVMMAEVRRQFGAGIFEELHDEADKRWQAKIKPAAKP
jgi:hypothetical protein